jgi:excisionase family DNA binding protein
MNAVENDPEQLLTSTEVGELIQVNPTSVNNWIEEGRLRAFRTPGGHRRIRRRDVIEFLASHNMPIPRGMESAARRRRLIVDDNRTLLASFTRLLRPYREDVDVAMEDNGIDALVRVGSFRPHVVILDVFMPEVDGIEVCRKLKSGPETRGIEVFVTSGQLTPDIERKALAAGASRCFHKPIDLPAILRELRLIKTATVPLR